MRKLLFILALFLPLLGLANIDPPELEASEQITLQVDVTSKENINIEVLTLMVEKQIYLNIKYLFRPQLKAYSEYVNPERFYELQLTDFKLIGLKQTFKYNFKQYPKKQIRL